ncbi:MULTISPECIES: DUF1302 domain-containing protein [Pseudomonas]|uniref:DUF1302 domain-containing protein n=1 Tax=Pseudomonas nitroreducens TaxID=46680 RepID=UPI001E4B6AE5|nr:MULTISPECIES: DUF1302 family protein [Pseudomonas]MCE4071507.1 DUF1302 domain-containing protein [Pseudomonas nitritireducens]MCE4081283.1 DUF1302 domain-containing protein [Pseudomonas nitroreducens]
MNDAEHYPALSNRYRSKLHSVGVCMMLGIASSADAMEIDTGVEGLSTRFDNTVRYNLGWRVDGRDKRIANNSAADDGDYKFDRGENITNRVDVLSEFELDWRNLYGIRVSGTTWYDDAYSDVSVKSNPSLGGQSSYDDNKYSSFTKRYYRGPSAEFLDAFAYANLTVDDRPINVKAGRHVVYWGTSIFTQGGIAYSQHPIDARKSAATPGTETRETFLPLTQLSLQSQVTDMLSVAAQYYLDWDHIRIPEGGTYLGTSDFLMDGPDRFGGRGPTANWRLDDPLEPDRKTGNWGINAKLTIPEWNATTFGAYYREFDEKNGFWVLRDPSNPTHLRAVFPENTKLIGLSMDTSIGANAVGAELMTRRNGGLSSIGLSQANEGARGNTWHALVNTIFALPNTPLWDTGTVTAELTYDYLDEVTKNEKLFNGADRSTCPLGKKAGCATRDAWGFNIAVKPQYLAIIPGVDLSIPLTLGGGLHGNTADFGGVSEGAYTYSVGMEADIRRAVIASLTWADSSAQIVRNGSGGYTGAGSWQTTDRGRVTLTLKTSF